MPYKTIDEYISGSPEKLRPRLERMRRIIHTSAPGAKEAMAYGIPTFRLHGNLVHFAGFATHIGFYPTPSGIAAFKRDLSVYKHAKGSVQFPNDKPLPEKLIQNIVRFRVRENKKSSG
ncbi:MAG: DUF1801 domain-containing protein [Chitinispirillaceae bacterium]|nr:DUF1801 domain-containing protein [Chitinispirillaceae bacterium]